MLPLFQIITPTKTKTMSINDTPVKPRRKKPEVPIHKDPGGGDSPPKRTYGANFSAKRGRHKQEVTEVILELPESDSANKISKKHLNREIQRLNKENEDVVAKFNELEELSVKKITKLKEKLGDLQTKNYEILKENNFIKGKYGELVEDFEDLKRELQLSKNCQNCEDLKIGMERLGDENNSLSGKNKELNEDLNMLKTVVYRLNLQLERYQDNLRKHNIKVTKSSTLINSQLPETPNPSQTVVGNIFSENHQNHTHTPIAWGTVNVHTLGPLLDAYQDTIAEKEEIIANYETEIANFTGKLKEIIQENDVLYRRLTEDDDCSSKLKEEVQNLKKELKSIKDQNDILIKKCALKQDKVEEILKCYEHKVEQLKRDYTVAQEQYYRVRSEATALKEKNKALIDAQDDFKNERHNYIPVSVHTSSVNECKRWYEELKVQYEQEKNKLKDALDLKNNLINELERKITTVTKQKEDLDTKITQLEKHIKKGEAKYLELEHTLNQVQLSKSACKKQLHKAMSFAKDMVAEQETLLKALNQRQLENKVVKKIGDEMASKMDSLKTQLKDVQKSAWQEFTTVEQKIQDQEELIESMRDEHEKEIEKLQQIIKEHEEQNSLKNENIPMSPYLLFRNKHK